MDDGALELLDEHEARALRDVGRAAQVARLRQQRRVRVALDGAPPLRELLLARGQVRPERERLEVGGGAGKWAAAASLVKLGTATPGRVLPELLGTLKAPPTSAALSTASSPADWLARGGHAAEWLVSGCGQHRSLVVVVDAQQQRVELVPIQL